MSNGVMTGEVPLAIGPAPVPGACTNLTAIQPDPSKDTALVSFVAPATDDQGRPLESLVSAEVYYRDSSFISEIENLIGVLSMVKKDLTAADIGQLVQVEVPNLGFDKTVYFAVRPTN
jgi:hypothetical protein